MSELKTLKEGDWLRDKIGGGIGQVAFILNAQLVLQRENGTIAVWTLRTIDEYFDRLPDCNSFFWIEPKPEPTRTPIRLWMSNVDGRVFASNDRVPFEFKEIKSDGEGGWYV